VEADSQVDLKPVVAGDAIEVTTVAVQNDQAVTKGQVIAILDNSDARRSVVNAELSLHQTEIKAKQTNKLYPKLNRKESKYQTPDKRKPKVLGCPDSVKTDKKTDSHA
jgi:multidrug resistance efflux pump